jgi:hypothetical protein
MGGKISLFMKMDGVELPALYTRLGRLSYLYAVFAIILIITYFTRSSAGWAVFWSAIFNAILFGNLKALCYLGAGNGVSKCLLLWSGQAVALCCTLFSILRLVTLTPTAISAIEAVIVFFLSFPMVLILNNLTRREANGGETGVDSGLAQSNSSSGEYKPPNINEQSQTAAVPVAYANYA